MKLKVDANGNVVLQDGMPVYIHEDGAEAPYDAAGAQNRIKELSAEQKARRLANEELTAKLAVFEGLDPKIAREAMATVANLKDKQLVDAGEMDKVKKGLTESYEANLAQTKQAYEGRVQELSAKIEAKDQQVRKLLIQGAFTNSKFLADKTVLPPDVAYAVFGKHFSIEEVNDELIVVALLDGEKLFSRTNPGHLASPEEAIAAIVEKYPHKDRILRQQAGGSGAPNSGAVGSDGKTDFKALHSAAAKAGNVQQMISIKNAAAAAGVIL